MLSKIFGGNRSNQPKASSVWPRTVGLNEFSADTPDGLVITKDVWFTWRYRVPAQQIVRFGTGSIVGGVDNRGVLMLSMMDDTATPVSVPGDSVVQIGYENANQTNFLPIWEGRLDQINDTSAASSRTSNNVLGEVGPGSRQDSYLVIRVKPSATSTGKFKDANSDFRVPVTIYTL